MFDQIRFERLIDKINSKFNENKKCVMTSHFNKKISKLTFSSFNTLIENFSIVIKVRNQIIGIDEIKKNK